jgi:serine kinase of HPr protein (carbohydrate metabolism regulator)
LTVTDTHTISASCPPNITGLLEVRGIGIIEKPFIPSHHIDYVIELVTDYPRMPDMVYFNYKNIAVRKFLLNPFEISVLNKIQAITTMI